LRRTSRGGFLIKLILFIILLVLIIPAVIYVCPKIIGANDAYIVLSGSMKPTIYPGDIVFARAVNPRDIIEGDIIVANMSSRLYTHRVIDKIDSDENILFRLKGDANEDPDPSHIKGSQIIGKVAFILPTRYFYNKSSYLVFVLIPLVLLVFYQVFKMYMILTYNPNKRRRKRGIATLIFRNSRNRHTSILDTTVLLLLMILLVSTTWFMLPRFAPNNLGSFYDKESLSVSAKAGEWKNPSTVTCFIVPNNTTYYLGDLIVITGSVSPIHKEVNLTLECSINGSEITQRISTDSAGTYSYLQKLNKPGVWNIKVKWDGNRYYYGASCKELSFKVLNITEG